MNVYLIGIYERNLYSSVGVDSYTYTLKIDESLDSGVLTIPRSTRREKFARFSRVSIYVSDGTTSETKDWLIYTTRVEIESFGSTKRYTHTLGIIEPTKWLDKFQVGSMSFRQPADDNAPRKSLFDYVDRLMDLVPFVQYDRLQKTRLFRLDSTFKGIIENVIAPNIDWETKNYREALITLFKVVNAIPRLYYDYGWVLTGDFINQRHLPITIGDGDIDYLNEADGEDFGQAIEIFHENTSPADDEGIVFENSITDFVTFRNNEIILGDSNLQLHLSAAVEKLYNISALIYDSSTFPYVFELNLNEFAFEKSVYDTLQFIEGFLETGKSTKELAFYWTHKSNILDGFSETFGALFEYTAIERILQFLEIDDDTSINYITFKVEYKPFFENSRSKQYREDIEPYSLSIDLLDDESAIQINQGERINQLYDLTENTYGLAQRTGVDTVSFSRKHYNLADIYSVGDYTTDGYFITKVEVLTFTTFFIARYEASKNWNRIAQFIQLDKEFRGTEVSFVKTNYTVKRDVIFNLCFVELSSEANALTLLELGDGISIIRSTFMNTFKSGTYQNNLGVIEIKRDEDSFGVAKPCAAMAEKNVLKWKLDMPDTKLAGKRVVRSNSVQALAESQNIVNALEQREVVYTNADGTIDFLNISMLNTIWYFPYENYTNPNDFFGGSNVYTHGTIRVMSERMPYIDDYYNVVVLRDMSNYDDDIFIHVDSDKFVEDSLELPAIGEADKYYVTEDTYRVYTWNGSSYDWVETAIAIKNDYIYQFPIYKLSKDSAEVLGIEIAMPVLPQYDEINKFIIGKEMIKENLLLKPRETSKTLYWYGSSARFTKNDSDKIPTSTTTQISSLSDLSVFPTGIVIPSAVYDNYDYYALGDNARNMYFAVNQKDFAGTKVDIPIVYFNFLVQRKQPDYAVIPTVRYYVNIELEDSISITYEYIQQENYQIDLVLSDTFEINYEFTIQPTIKVNITMSDAIEISYAYTIIKFIYYKANIMINDAIEISYVYEKAENQIYSVDINMEDNVLISYGYITSESETMSANITMLDTIQISYVYQKTENNSIEANIVMTDTFAVSYGLYKGYLDWDTSDSTEYAAATYKTAIMRDSAGDAIPNPEDLYNIYHECLRRTVYNMQLSNLIEYNAAGTKINIATSTEEVTTLSAPSIPEDVFEDEGSPSDVASYQAGTLLDTVIKITDMNLNVTYWKPDYSDVDYYIAENYPE